MRTLMLFDVLAQLANAECVLKGHAVISSGMGMESVRCGVGAAQLSAVVLKSNFSKSYFFNLAVLSGSVVVREKRPKPLSEGRFSVDWRG